MNLQVLLQALEQLMRGYYNVLLDKLTRTVEAVQAHVSNLDNPHQVDKTHVGLEFVQNLPVATADQAGEGLSNSAYMTPLRTTQAIIAQGGGVIADHVGDTDNPHQVSKAQVGLSQLENYPVADETAARAGTSGVLYMTPQRTAQAIDELVFIELAAVFDAAADDLE